MPHEILASIRLTLPDAPQRMAELLGEIASAWAEFLSAVEDKETEATFSVNETRAKPGPKPAANGGTQRAPRRTRTGTGTNSAAAELPPGEAAAQEAGA